MTNLCRFEDIEIDKVKEVTRILDSLNIPYSNSEVISKLEDDYAEFKRYLLNNSSFRHNSGA